jgi:putative membrane protein
MLEALKNFIYGALIGIANAIPGVSGGTMAVILNVFDKIMYAVSLKNIKDHLKFLIPLGLGAVAGVFALSNVIVSLLDTHAMLLNFCFIGLIIGSLPSIYDRARDGKIKSLHIALCILAFAFMIFMGSLNKAEMTNSSLEDMGGLSLAIWLYLIVTVCVSTIAMILPGISGSLMMLLFGVYTIVMGAIADLNFLLMLPIGVGVLSGLFIGVKVIKNLLRNHHQALYFVILGLVAGSIFAIYPGFTANAEGFASLAGMVVFGLAAFFLSNRR